MGGLKSRKEHQRVYIDLMKFDSTIGWGNTAITSKLSTLLGMRYYTPYPPYAIGLTFASSIIKGYYTIIVPSCCYYDMVHYIDCSSYSWTLT